MLDLPVTASGIAQLAVLLDGLELALCVFDEEDRTLAWNETFLRFFPEHAGHVRVGEPYRDNLLRFYRGRLGADEIPFIEDHVARGIARHRAQTRPFTFDHRGRLLRVNAQTLPGLGRVRTWTALDRVATAPNSERRATSDDVPDGVLHFDESGAITAFNQAFARLYGLTSTDCILSSTFEAILETVWARAATPENAARFAQEVRPRLVEAQRFPGAPFEVELPGARWVRVLESSIPARERTSAHFDVTHLKGAEAVARAAEAKAREANQRLLLAEQIAQIGNWRLEWPSGRLTWSDGVYRIYGREPAEGELSFESAIEACEPEDRDEVRHLLERAVEEKRDYECAMRLRRPDGTVRAVIARGLCEVSATGTLTAVFGTIMDVTDLREAERAAAQKSAVLAATLDNMDQGLILIDAARRIPICNRRAVELLDLSPAVMAAGTTIDEVLRLQMSTGEFAGADMTIQGFLKTGGMILEHTVYERTRPNGTVLEVRTVPLPDGGAVRTYTDVTARRTAERALVQSEARYRLLADNVSDLIILARPNGERYYISPAVQPMLGFTVEEAGAVGMRVWVHPHDLAQVFATTIGLSTEAPTASLVYRLRHKAGHYIWAEAAFQRVEADGAVTIITAIRDVTQRQEGAEALKVAKEAAERAQALAEAASEAKSEFLASMSHEIRTPLNGMLGYTDLLLEEGMLVPEHRRHLERIQTSGAALLTVVNDILDFSKIEAGQVTLETRPFSLRRLVDDTVSIVRGQADRKRLAFRIEVEAGLVDHRLGDEDRLRQVLLNLLNNAAKFTPSGAVTLRVQGADAELRFAVEDTGIGVPADKVHRLFERFSQVDGSIRRQYGGTGLGLAICKRLVELMGGTIGVSSGRAIGAEFWFAVPLEVTEALAHLPADAQGTTPQVHVAARILLAEDLAINQELAKAVLERAGHHVKVVGDGSEAIRELQEGQYDLVLMDVQMPGTDGLTATRRIRALDGPISRVPILAMTANVLPHQVRLVLEAGMDGHIGKPFKRDELLDAVSRWAASGRGDAGKSSAAGSGDAVDFDLGAYDEMAALVGADRMTDLLRSLVAQVRTLVGTACGTVVDHAALANEAHALVSAAGQLGFEEVSELCRDVERTCMVKGDVGAMGQRLTVALDRALHEAGRLMAA